MEKVHLEDILSIYFSRVFPYKELYRWLSYGEEHLFSCREFAFNFEGERFLRHQAYNDIDQLKHSVKKHRPVKIDIGAIYNVSPLDHMRDTIFYPVQRELAFDIDLTDYDEIRTCCSGVNICLKCWKYMEIAVKILDIALREDFGFDHILWVFSGRRGIHCWVCDKRARFLKHNARIGIANYLQLVTGGEYKKKKVEIIDKMHHSVKRALAVVEPLFTTFCVKEQDMLGTEERVLKFLGIIAEPEVRTEVKNILDQYETSLTKWEAFVEFYKTKIRSGSKEWCKTPFLIEEIMIQYAYPRLDIQVTLAMSHLLKSPFCVHPKTGLIGVPIDPNVLEEFSPFKIPTILELMKEIDLFDVNAKKEGISTTELKRMEDIKKTSLNKYLTIFSNFINALETSY